MTVTVRDMSFLFTVPDNSCYFYLLQISPVTYLLQIQSPSHVMLCQNLLCSLNPTEVYVVRLSKFQC